MGVALRGGQVKAELEAVRGQAADMARDNTILKRAVAIQNGRIQELGTKEAQLQQARQLLQQYQEKLHHLEMTNYSLQVSARVLGRMHGHPSCGATYCFWVSYWESCLLPFTCANVLTLHTVQSVVFELQVFDVARVLFLQVHLRQATDSRDHMGGLRQPDVF